MKFHGYTIKATGNPTPHRGWDWCGFDWDRLDYDYPVEFHGYSPDDIKAQITNEFWDWFLGMDFEAYQKWLRG